MQFLDAPLAIVDVETTGAHPVHDRVTEIGVVEVDAGEVVSEWSTLVNPETAIPPAIQALTGITDAMVEDAPRFGTLAEALLERLAGRVLVAHNARFDYAFLRREFDRAGLEFQARTLCTVKLSRRLYPEHARHNLDSLIARHGLACGARHRALGDAQAVWQFLRIARDERGGEALAAAAQGLARETALPPQLERVAVDAIPEAPGVYVFFGESGAPLYVGKSRAMRSRVLQHFAGDTKSQKEMQLAREVSSIEWQRTAGELGALLREAEMVKALQPAHNRRLRRATALCGFGFDGRELVLEEAADLPASAIGRLHGLFRSRRAALEALKGLADAHGLCLGELGFDRSARPEGPCFRHQIRRCAGACAGRESPQAHLGRLAAALARLPRIAWPYRGAIGIVEEDAERDATEVHVVNHWTWLGTARCETEVAGLLQAAAAPRFDLDQYRVLARHLRGGRAKVVEFA